MAEPPIKSRLESTELSTNPSPIQNRLNACLAFDAAHIQPGQKGDHVKVIQQALNTIRKRRPDIAMIEINDAPGTWGDDTTNAVIRYKSFNHIIRTLQKLDPIVGRMTLTQLDNDLLKPVPPPPPSPAQDDIKVVAADIKNEEAMREVAQSILDSGRFAGRDFSSADEYIYRTAKGYAGPGNPTTWREINTTHHITQVISDIGKIEGFSVARLTVEDPPEQLRLLR